jgi:hypothetical protein
MKTDIATIAFAAKWRNSISDFREVWALLGFYLVDAIGGIPSLNTWMVSHFSLEHGNPVGLILSITVYDGWVNTAYLAAAASSFLLATLSLGGIDKRKASKFFVSISILGAIVGNTIWYISDKGPNLPVRGTSGVTMASIGISFVPALMCISVIIVRDLKIKFPTRRAKLRWRRANWSIAYVAFSLVLICWSTALLTLYSATGNSVIHSVSLLFGIIASTLYFMPKLKSQDPWSSMGKPVEGEQLESVI